MIIKEFLMIKKDIPKARSKQTLKYLEKRSSEIKREIENNDMFSAKAKAVAKKKDLEIKKLIKKQEKKL